MGFLSSAKDLVMGKAGGSETVNRPDEVWSEQIPYLKDVYKTGSNFADRQMKEGSDFQKQQGNLVGAWQQQLSGPTNPYLTGMASNAMAQISKQFNEQIMPSLLGGGNTAGQLGSERYQQLQDSAVDTAATAMANAGQNVYGQAWDAGLGAQSAAIGQGSNVTGNAWQPLLNKAAIIGSPTVLGQGGYSETENPQEGLLSMAAKGWAAKMGAPKTGA